VQTLFEEFFSLSHFFKQKWSAQLMTV